MRLVSFAPGIFSASKIIPTYQEDFICSSFKWRESSISTRYYALYGSTVVNAEIWDITQSSKDQ